MTVLEAARKGEVTPLISRAALSEGVTPEQIRDGVAKGEIVLLHSQARPEGVPVAVGKGLRAKVSASIGLFGKRTTIDGEAAKIKAALRAGTDTIMDLSAGGEIDLMRRKSMQTTKVPVGTLPLYQALSEAAARHGSSTKMEVEELFRVIERQAADGVDFMAVHGGMTMKVVERAKKMGRVDPLVSYGGSHLIGWMVANEQENPFYEHYDRLLEIAHRYDITVSLADGMRPGALADSLDSAMMDELTVLGELVRRAGEAGVQVMVKGPGHIPLNRLREMVTLEKSLCHGAPYFVFGPLVTDIALGYDQINAAIGGAISAWAGADFLCYVTAAEHAGLPTARQVYDGVIAACIAAHAADIGSDKPGARDWDLKLSQARKEMDWHGQFALAIDPQHAEKMKKERGGDVKVGCAMCGKYCAAEIVAQYLHTEKHTC